MHRILNPALSNDALGKEGVFADIIDNQHR